MSVSSSPPVFSRVVVRASRAHASTKSAATPKSAGGTRRRDDAPCRSRRRSLALGVARWRRSFAHLSPLRRIARVRARRARGNRTRPRFARPCRVRARATPWPRSRDADVGSIRYFIDVDRSSGNYVVDADGNTILDMYAHIASLPVGYNHPKMLAALRDDENVGVLAHRPALGTTRRLGGIKGWRGRSCEWRPRD